LRGNANLEEHFVALRNVTNFAMEVTGFGMELQGEPYRRQIEQQITANTLRGNADPWLQFRKLA
jgi:hypothetical protein